MDWDDLNFLDPRIDIRQTENRLPHWQQNAVVYFVTFHLGDSLPANLLKQLAHDRNLWLNLHPKPWTPELEAEYHKCFSGATESWLDAGHGSCLFRQPDCAAILADALAFFDGDRYDHIAWVVMPNHAHCLFAARPHWPLEKVLQSWKRYSARRINEHLGRSGALWHRDYFDRLVRDSHHLSNCIRYIRNNPGKARLGQGEYLHYENDLARTVQ